jgi:small subunit ribosomal protein S8
MTMSDPLGDMLTRIRNGQRVRKTSVLCPASKLRANVLDVLRSEGYIRGWRRLDEESPADKPFLEIELKYHDGDPVIQEINRISTPGRRVYSSIKDLPRTYSGLGISILSTPRGVMSDTEARAANVGGEVLCRVF